MRFGVIAAYGPNLPFFFGFWSTGGGKAFVSTVVTISPDAGRMRPLRTARCPIPEAHVPRRQSFRGGLTHSWPQELGWAGGYQGPWAPSQPLRGAPPARGTMMLGFCRTQAWCVFLDVSHKTSTWLGLQATRYALLKQVYKYSSSLRTYLFVNPRS